MITFIVTTYNLEDWLLRRCLESITAQGIDRESYEIIVVDDESIVSPQHIIDEFAQKANITLYIQEHARQGAARNLALQHAKGEWIQFVDGDDYLYTGAIAPLLKLAEENNLDLLTYGFNEVGDEAGASTNHRKGFPSDTSQPNGSNNSQFSILNSQLESGDSYMLHHNLFGSCCTLLFRRSLCEEECYGSPLRFTENIYIEDEEFITKLVWRAQRMASTDAIVYAYYQRPGSTVHNRSREHTDELFRNYFVVLKRLIDFEREVVGKPHDGLTRKIRFFAIDILRRALREPDWKDRWYRSAMELLGLNLYPIPSANYSWKYRIFRLLAQRSLGRHVLRIIEKRQQR
ncbi:MAG: glycosyltransferase [Bacteroidaceae bacterium]|nr:glycosyltransferase [Bacteroidaceae bacterium]